MFAKISSLGLFGLNAFQVDVEIDMSRGQPQFDIVGLPDTAVKESRERIRSALRACEINFPVASIMINLAPANTRKSGSVHDMAIFMAILKVLRLIPQNIDDCSFIGEVSLNGNVRRINGVLPMATLAKECGIKKLFVPYENSAEASVVSEIEVYGIKNVSELIQHFIENKPLAPVPQYVPNFDVYDSSLDFSDVKGQQTAKKALEIATAGGHNAIMIGTPGSGKSMLAKRMSSILPPLTFEEALETTKIHSISGLLSPESPIITYRPFRSPHHTISSAGLAGGGTIPRPGEVSLAHNGLLFLDELPEFDKRTLEIMRQPLEDKKVTISRASGSITYPCNIMLIAAMNPCPCGYYGHPKRQCICSGKKVSSYISRISGPLLDRFDLHIEVAPIEFSDISSSGHEESSSEIRKRVMKARKIQQERFKGTDIRCNARITPDKLHQMCPIDSEAEKVMQSAFDRLGFSGRAYERIMKVARTIADLNDSEIINKKHISSAIQYRSLDRKYWNNME